MSGYFEPTFASWKSAYERGKKSPEANLYLISRKAIESQVLHPEYTLTGRTSLQHLSPMRRVKMGKYRLVYVACKKKKIVILLYVGRRRDGDKNDVYKVVKGLKERGRFDEEFAEVGLKT